MPRLPCPTFHRYWPYWYQMEPWRSYCFSSSSMISGGIFFSVEKGLPGALRTSRKVSVTTMKRTGIACNKRRRMIAVMGKSYSPISIDKGIEAVDAGTGHVPLVMGDKGKPVVQRG